MRGSKEARLASAIFVVMSALKLLSDAALAVGLIVAGGGLSFTYALSRPWLIGAVSAVKLTPITGNTIRKANAGKISFRS